MSLRNYFVSDLHMFSRRSKAGEYGPAINRTAQEADRFILGGDIFDFRWSELPNVEKTIESALNWLQDLVAKNRSCEFHFVLGNHDYNRRFIAGLADLSSQEANLSWHRFHLRIGRSFFLHGDAADKPRMNPQSLALHRQQWSHDEPGKGPLANWLYDRAIDARLHHLAHVVHRKKRVASRIFQYAGQTGHGPESGLEHVYFGHTHCAVADYRYNGVLFHNGGAPMKGLKFRIVKAEVNE